MMVVSKQYQIFFDFLRFCIGSESEIPSSLKEADWEELYAIAKKQCLVGVLFDGIKKLPAEQVGMKMGLLFQWIAKNRMLEKANVRLNDAAIQVSESAPSSLSLPASWTRWHLLSIQNRRKRWSANSSQPARR